MLKLNIKYTLTAPCSHIGETASTGSYFQTIKMLGGRLPIITANSVRGTLRDNGAKYLLDRIGIKVDKEIFNVLFSGGNLNTALKMDVGKAKLVREKFPFVSLFGGGLGDMILSGKMCVGNIYPICKESYIITGIESETSYKNLIDEIEFTRTDDIKNDTLAEKFVIDPDDDNKSKANTQMRYSVQYLAAGVQLVQTIILFDNVTDLETAALLTAFSKWFECPRIGGMANKGFGFFDAEADFGVSVKDKSVLKTNEFEEYEAMYNEYASKLDPDDIKILGSGKNGKK